MFFRVQCVDPPTLTICFAHLVAYHTTRDSLFSTNTKEQLLSNKILLAETSDAKSSLKVDPCSPNRLCSHTDNKPKEVCSKTSPVQELSLNLSLSGFYSSVKKEQGRIVPESKILSGNITSI